MPDDGEGPVLSFSCSQGMQHLGVQMLGAVIESIDTQISRQLQGSVHRQVKFDG